MSARRGTTAGWTALAIALLMTVADARTAASEHYALVVTGVSGGQKYAAAYEQWRTRLVAALEEQYGFSTARVTVLAERPGPGVARASREAVLQVLSKLRAAVGRDDLLLVVLIGHGTADGNDAKFNLVGPDLDASEWARLFDRWPSRLVFVNTSASSAPFLKALAGPNRVVITATDSAAQRFDTMFPEALVQALEGRAADANKDARLSVREAFSAASRAVGDWYRERGQLPTERALLDDRGDGVGKNAGAPGADMSVADKVHLDAIPPPPPTLDAATASLTVRRDALLVEVARLNARRETMKEDDYARQLEEVLVELARVSRQLRK